MKGSVVFFVLLIFTTLSRTYSQETSDEQPLVYSKRAALLLDRLLVALTRALEDDADATPVNGNNWRPPGTKDGAHYRYEGQPTNEDFPMIKGVQRPQPRIASRNINDMELRREMGLQRRDQISGTTTTVRGNIWRCYFNAVTCF